MVLQSFLSANLTISCVDTAAARFAIADLLQHDDAIEMIYVPAECKQEILKDARALKNRTPSLTKNQVVRGVARIFAKIKLKGYDFATAFNEELPKTIGKIFAEKGVNYVLEQLPKLLHHFLP